MLAIASVATLMLALAGRAVLGSPTVAPSFPTSFAISTLDFTAVHRNASLARGRLHYDAASTIIATLWMCEGADCGGTCTFANLGGIPANECTLNNPFTSVIVDLTFSPGTPFEVVVGPRDCPEVIAIPAANECFNLSGALFEGYAIIE
ncbi:hypothetical protein BV20DRAFT_38604 [Pilatotrama ljubarskyi]|nr:hypothetical protein BV20DRAFT_38604 [Pilatotrama ljubarskyi]